MDMIYNSKNKLQNRGLTHESMLLNVISYKFCQSIHIYNKKKRSTDIISMYFFEETCVKFLKKSTNKNKVVNIKE